MFPVYDSYSGSSARGAETFIVQLSYLQIAADVLHTGGNTRPVIACLALLGVCLRAASRALSNVMCMSPGSSFRGHALTVGPPKICFPRGPVASGGWNPWPVRSPLRPCLDLVSHC